MKIIAVLLIAISILPLEAKKKKVFDETKRAVTHNTGGGRFGDKLLGYAHAKWISYKYGIPLLYRPFPYSDQLLLHSIEERYKSSYSKQFRLNIIPGYKQKIDYSKRVSALYIIPYFPECLWERQLQKLFYYLPVEWNHRGFREVLKKHIKPIHEYPHVELPVDRKSVAIHIRHGGGFDSDHTRQKVPLKLPPESFYIEQLKEVHQLLGQQPLFVYIFTDYQKPVEIIERFESHFEGMDIVFDARREGNSHDSHVLADFFEMARFDCLIRPESNFSIMASKLAEYEIQIKPTRFKWVEDKVHIDEVEVEIALPTGDDDKYLQFNRYRVSHAL